LHFGWLTISRNEEDDLGDPNYKKSRSCNKFGERIALWSTIIGNGSNFVKATRFLLKSLQPLRVIRIKVLAQMGNEVTSLLATLTIFLAI